MWDVAIFLDGHLRPFLCNCDILRPSSKSGRELNGSFDRTVRIDRIKRSVIWELGSDPLGTLSTALRLLLLL
jgi:hypothetical protein